MSGRRVALVTGGARRLGAEIVRRLAARDFDVLLHHGHSPREAEALATELRAAHGGRVDIVQADLADPNAPAQIVHAAIERLGALDVVVSSASVMHARAFAEVTAEEWQRTEAVNLRAPFFLMQAAAAAMRDGGVIIQLSDHLATETGSGQLIPHAVTKSALTQLIRTVAVAVAPRLRVNGVAPGLVLAPDGMSEAAIGRFLRDVPLAQSGTPQAITRAIDYLIDADYVTGEILTVDGGRHLRRSPGTA